MDYTPRQAFAFSKWSALRQRSEARLSLAITRGNERTLEDMQSRWKKADWKALEE